MRRFISWQRNRDFLKELQVIVAVGLIGTLLVMIFKVFDLITGDAIVTALPLQPDEPPGFDNLAAGVTFHPASEISVEIAQPTIRQKVLFGLVELPAAALIVVVLALLTRVIHHARRTHPFTRRTVNGLRWMGLTLFAGISAAAGQSWAQLALTESIVADRWGAVMTIPFAWLVGGFLCFAAAEVVQRGVLMREELAAVI